MRIQEQKRVHRAGTASLRRASLWLLLGVCALGASSCSKTLQVGEVEEVAHATADLLASLDESLEPFHSHLSALLHEEHPIEHFEPCSSLGWTFCQNSERVRYVSDCASGLGSHLEGEIHLRFSDPICPSTPSDGLVVEHRAFYTLSGRDDSAEVRVSSREEAEGGRLVLGAGESFTWQVRGVAREAAWNRDQPWTRIRMETLSPIVGEGHARAERVLTSGRLRVSDSIQNYALEIAIQESLRWSDPECNCPVGGEWRGSLVRLSSGQPGDSQAVTVTFPSCGTALLTLAGETSRSIRLDRCGAQPL